MTGRLLMLALLIAACGTTSEATATTVGQVEPTPAIVAERDPDTAEREPAPSPGEVGPASFPRCAPEVVAAAVPVLQAGRRPLESTASIRGILRRSGHEGPRCTQRDCGDGTNDCNTCDLQAVVAAQPRPLDVVDEVDLVLPRCTEPLDATIPHCAALRTPSEVIATGTLRRHDGDWATYHLVSPTFCTP